MPEILTYNSPSEVEKKRTKQPIFKSFFDFFDSKDKFTKLSLITFALIIIATPFVVNQYLDYRQSASSNKTVVEITKDGFVPASIQVFKGAKVTWTNIDNNLHKVSSDLYSNQPNLTGFASSNLAKGDSFSYIFIESGSYTYHDQLNALKYKGVVIVK